MKLLQAGRGGAILLLAGLALLQPARAHVSHRERAGAPATVAPLPTPAPAAMTPAPEAPSAVPEPSPSPIATATDAPSVQPAAIETGLVPIPSPTPKPPPLRVNPGLFQTVASPTQGTPAGSATFDNASDLAGGVWYCRTFAGSVMTHAFSKSDSASSLAVETHVPVDPNRIVTLHESYAYRKDAGKWRAVLAEGSIEATAPVWNGDSWTFTGRQREGDKSVEFRMIFTRFGRDVFVRDFQHHEGGTWQTFSGETCRRNVEP